MTILFEVGHPAHLHYFKNAAQILESKGHLVFFSMRDKDITRVLLDKHQFKYFNIGRNKKGFVKKIFGTINFTLNDLSVINQVKPDIAVSFYSPYLAYAAFLKRIPSIGFADTEHAIYSIKSTYPFTDVSITPKYFTSDLGDKHLKFDGFMELCYLHPNYFKPNVKALSELNLKKDKYVVLRFISWDAHHDVGQFGLDLETKRRIIEILQNEYQVFISSEGTLPPEFEAYRLNIPVEQIHNVLSYAHLYVGEGATMASECAMLGTPAIYVNSLNAGTLCEQESYGLIAGFRNSTGVIEKLEKWLSDKNLKRDTEKKRDKMVSKMIDPTKLMVWFIENYPVSKSILKKNPEYQRNFA